MKLSLIRRLVLAAVCATSLNLGAQEAAQLVYDSALDAQLSALNGTTTNIKAVIDQLLAEAQKQNEKLQQQLDHLGDYQKANLNQPATVIGAQAAVSAAQSNIVGELPDSSNVTLKSNNQLVTERSALTGAEVFTDSPDGTLTGIGNTYTYKVRETTKDAATGKTTSKMVEKTADRDATLYTDESKREFDLKEFYRIRDEALAKQQKLEAARWQALQDQAKATDDIESQRLATLIETINAELATCRQDVANASQDVLMHEKTFALQKALDLKAKSERPDRKPTTQDKLQELIDNARANSKTGPAAKDGFPFGTRFDPK